MIAGRHVQHNYIRYQQSRKEGGAPSINTYIAVKSIYTIIIHKTGRILQLIWPKQEIGEGAPGSPDLLQELATVPELYAQGQMMNMGLLNPASKSVGKI